MDGPSLKGKLLVATPLLGDPNFHRTVVLMLEHGDEGAVGLVLNRPSETAVAGPLPQWKALTADPDVVFVGGPVRTEMVIGLGRRRPQADVSGRGPGGARARGGSPPAGPRVRAPGPGRRAWRPCGPAGRSGARRRGPWGPRRGGRPRRSRARPCAARAAPPAGG